MRICIADDNDDFRLVLEKMLHTLGHHVPIAASSGEELLAECPDNTDAIIVDLNMAEMDGLAVAEAIRDKGPKVILVSGHDDIHHIVVDREPISAVMVKPVGIDQLATVLDKLH